MNDVIFQLSHVLNIIKGFLVGYSSDDLKNGYMYLKYNKKRYAIQIKEMNEDDQKTSDLAAIDHVKYYF